MENIRLDIGADSIGVAWLDAPGLPFNVFSESMMSDLESLIDFAQNELAGLVLTSRKSAFAAGADLAMIKDFADMRFDASRESMRQRFSRLGRLFRALEQLPIPTVAAINGLALGGGLEVAMSCHARVCADIAAPILGLPEVSLGLLPGAGGTQRLPRYIGVRKAMKMLLGGAPITPAAALENGLLSDVVPGEVLIDRACTLVRQSRAQALWDNPRWQADQADLEFLESDEWYSYCLEAGGWAKRPHHLYPAVDAIIRCVSGGVPLSLEAGCDLEWDVFVELMSDPVAANMVTTCFLNKMAAPKRAQRTVADRDSGIGSICWESGEPQPGSLLRKLPQTGARQASIVIADAGASPTQDALHLLEIRTAKTTNETAATQLQFAGILADAEAIELMNPEAPAAGQAVSLTRDMAKLPVWVKHPGVMQRVLDALQIQASPHGDSDADIKAAAASVELDGMFRFCRGSAAAIATGEDAVTPSGLNLLTVTALAAYACLLDGTIADPEMLDVLAVYGIGFPKWTGGPIGFLAMVQRREIEVKSLDAKLLAAVQAIEVPLKIKAGYNPSIVSRAG